MAMKIPVKGKLDVSTRPARAPAVSTPAMRRADSGDFAAFLKKIQQLGLAPEVFRHLEAPLVKAKLKLIEAAAESKEEYFSLVWSLVQFNFSDSKMIQVATAPILVRKNIYSIPEVEGRLVGSSQETRDSLRFILERLDNGYAEQFKPLLLAEKTSAKAVCTPIPVLPKGLLVNEDFADQAQAIKFYTEHGAAQNLPEIGPFLQHGIIELQNLALEFYLEHGSATNLEEVKPFLKSLERTQVLLALNFYIKHGSSAQVAEIGELLESMRLEVEAIPDEAFLPYALDALEQGFGADWENARPSDIRQGLVQDCDLEWERAHSLDIRFRIIAQALRFFTLHAGPQELLTRIKAFLASDHIKVKSAALEFYAVHGNKNQLAEIRPLLESRYLDIIIAALEFYRIQAGPVELPEVEPLLKYSSPLVIRAALDVYLEHGGVDQLAEIKPFLVNQNNIVRQAAWEFYMVHGGASQLAEIRPLLEHSQDKVRSAAWKFYTVYGGKDQLAQIKPLLDNKRQDIARAAWQFYVKFGGKETDAPQEIESFLTHADPSIQTLAWELFSSSTDYAFLQTGLLPEGFSGLPTWVHASLLVRMLNLHEVDAGNFYDASIVSTNNVCSQTELSFKKVLRHGAFKLVNGSFALKLMGTLETTALCLGISDQFIFGGIYETNQSMTERVAGSGARAVLSPGVGWVLVRDSELQSHELLAMVFDLRFNARA